MSNQELLRRHSTVETIWDWATRCVVRGRPLSASMDASFDQAVAQQILAGGDFAFHVQARPEPRQRALRYRACWARQLFVLGAVPSKIVGEDMIA